MKYTVITGASSGIGYETALAFAKKGKNLILVARRHEQLKQLKEQINQINPSVDVQLFVYDLSVTENVYKFYEEANAFELETWINNAGFGHYGSVMDQDLTKIQNMLRLNNEALTIFSTLFVRDYANVEGTQLINISSAGGYTIIADNVTYCATKFFVSAFTEGLAQELQAKGAKMKAKVLAPAATESEFAKVSLGIDEFNYEGVLPKFHTSSEMAQLLIELYESDKIVGKVDGITYEYHLQDPILPHAVRFNRDVE
ncbi:SDR family NAD(P)-dependent oxidoreductase [Bacillus kexueae]|uniref:SDR family NAD(P)-dependent oxidoreductase n=1 Tax=Aeribacillus kexueae TaxID=2078952 RepID=UPI001FAF5860|nr:SDR family NAD(P)-dependent oxidoreductase [Bacillus kexueae]